MSLAVEHAYLIPLLPLLGFVWIVGAGLVRQWTRGSIRIGDNLAAIPSLVLVFAAWLQSLLVAGELFLNRPAGAAYFHQYPWLAAGSGGAALTLHFGWYIDAMAAMMLVVVTTVAAMVQLFSRGYMAGDPDYPRFYGYLSLFTSAMLVLVLASNLVELFVAWELMGLASYLLIGYWYQKPEAMRAAKKAFMVTRVGDLGLFFGIALLLSLTGTLDFMGMVVAQYPEGGGVQVPAATGWLEHMVVGAGPRILAQESPIWGTFVAGSTVLGVAAVLLFCGAVGKSAQFPLHVWLPDAMEGPTPVSALIHAATMVAAGIYLVARLYPVFDWGGPLTLAGFTFRPLDVVALIGLITAVLAALIALTQPDIKRILAYSTVSQLGFMMVGLGCGGAVVAAAGGHGAEHAAEAAHAAAEHGEQFAPLVAQGYVLPNEMLKYGFTAGMYHLMTHAFFKGLLFLGSGSIIHGTGTQDIWQMGGLRRLMPKTFAAYLIGFLALVGVPGFSGFFSKDLILDAAWEYNPLVFGVLVFAAFLTAFYMTRQMMVVFGGEWSGSAPAAADHPAGHAAADHGHEEQGDTQEHGHGVGPHPPHESGPSMLIPLYVLAALAVVAGLAGPFWNVAIYKWIHYSRPGLEAASHGINWTVIGSGTTAGLTGVLLGYLAYRGRRFALAIPEDRPAALLPRALYRLSFHKFYLDELYWQILVRPMFLFTRACWLMDQWVVDGMVRLTGWFGRATAFLSGLTDRFVVDGIVNGTGRSARNLGQGLRMLQSGQVQHYVLVAFAGVMLLIYFLTQPAGR